MKKKLYAGVLGFPVAHSWSPRIFTRLGEILSDPIDYRLLELEPANLTQAVRLLRKVPLLDGWNVTIPYKEKLYRQVDHLSPEAQLIGAINVVRRAPDGQLWGHNTDVAGVLKTLQEQNLPMKGETALIFGAGGGALAAGFALGRLGARQVGIVNRTLGRAQTQAKRLQKQFPATRFWACPEESILDTEAPKLFVQATPVGMKGFPKKSLFPHRLGRVSVATYGKRGPLAFDLIYRPERTPFLQSATQLGLATVGGLDMLLWQALATWEYWVGKIPEIQRVKDLLKQEFVTR